MTDLDLEAAGQHDDLPEYDPTSPLSVATHVYAQCEQSIKSLNGLPDGSRSALLSIIGHFKRLELIALASASPKGEPVNRQWCECYRRDAVADECANCDKQFSTDASPPAPDGIVLPAAFITCNSASPRYWVEIKTPTLKDAQRWHDAVLALAKLNTPEAK